MVGFFALAAMSTDTAAKVLHGIAHERESHEWMEHALVAHDHALAIDAGRHEPSSIGTPDVEADHPALHGAVTATVMPSLLMAIAVIVDLPIATIDTDRGALPRSVTQAAPPWVRARPSQPRAPPLG